MVLLRVSLNNIYGFKDFEVSFSYPRKIINSIIEAEHLEGRSNFRYKKALILMGANATGKTSLGKALLNIFKLIGSLDAAAVIDMIPVGTSGSFSIDFVNDGFTLHRVSCDITNAVNAGIHNIMDYEMRFEYASTEIGPKDSYEKSAERLNDTVSLTYNQFEEISKRIGKINYTFSCPDIKPEAKVAKLSKNVTLQILKAVIGTLDPTLRDVQISRDLKNSFIIRRASEEIIIQDGRLLNREQLSSGTAEGVDISFFLALLFTGKNGFYYCDEHFLYIQTDIEKRIFGLMLDNLGPNEQLIFTTHNTDMLELNLPKHSYAFLRKRAEDDFRVTVQFASELLKRDTDSVRCALENDMFSSIPDDSLLDSLEKGWHNE